MHIDPNHPRYLSLKYRERLVLGVKRGITSPAGLIAHGRGEAFDYLLGEKTHDFAKESIVEAARLLLTAHNPIISVNGNVAALLPKEISLLAETIHCPIEINLFHYTVKRAKLIESYLTRFSKRILRSSSKKVLLPRIASNRKMTLRDGIAKSDCVFVALEDGDRAQALVFMGKKVIAVDLNPLSRTAQTAVITIVDNITRAIPLLIHEIQFMKKNGTVDQKKHDFDNKKNLSLSIQAIMMNLKKRKNTRHV